MVLTTQIARMRETVRLAEMGEAGLLKIGITLGLAEKITTALVEHSKRYPKVEIHYENVISRRQQQALLNRQLDVGFLRGGANSTYLSSCRLFDESWMAVLPRSSRWTKRRSVRLKELGKETLLLHNDIPTEFPDRVVELCRKAGAAPKIILTPNGPYDEAGTMSVVAVPGVACAPAQLPP
jgi:DNA-binding transcriptional LysR family regulator